MSKAPLYVGERRETTSEALPLPRLAPILAYVGTGFLGPELVILDTVVS